MTENGRFWFRRDDLPIVRCSKRVKGKDHVEMVNGDRLDGQVSALRAIRNAPPAGKASGIRNGGGRGE